MFRSATGDFGHTVWEHGRSTMLSADSPPPDCVAHVSANGGALNPMEGRKVLLTFSFFFSFIPSSSSAHLVLSNAHTHNF